MTPNRLDPTAALVALCLLLLFDVTSAAAAGSTDGARSLALLSLGVVETSWVRDYDSQPPLTVAAASTQRGPLRASNVADRGQLDRSAERVNRFRHVYDSGSAVTTAAANARTYAIGASTADGASRRLTSAIAPRRAAKAPRTVTMCRNMGERVMPYAQRNGFDYYKGTPGWVPRKTLERISPAALQRTDLWFNTRWINREMRRDSDIVDIGEPAGYPKSPFYEMERQQVAGYPRYRQDLQP